METQATDTSIAFVFDPSEARAIMDKLHGIYTRVDEPRAVRQLREALEAFVEDAA